MDKPAPNQKLRAARMAMRLSQSEFATAVRHAGASLGEPNECTKRLVQKWEGGEHNAIRPNYRRALQMVTRIPYEQLGFLDAPSVPVVPMAQGVEAAMAAMPRSPAVRGLPQSGTEGDRLRYALTRPGNADEESITLIEAHTTHLFDLEHTRPARLLAPQVAAHLDDVATVLAGARRSVLRQKLAATGGRSAALAGWLAFDCGDVQGAHRWWDNALAAAQAAADGPLLACTLVYLSTSAADRGDPATAWHLANTALGHAGSNARTRSWMAARAAQEATTMGERYAAQVAVELSLELAESAAFADLHADLVEQPWATGFDLVCVYAMAASTYSRLGELKQSREMLARALVAMRSGLPGGGLGDGMVGMELRADSVRTAKAAKAASGATAVTAVTAAIGARTDKMAGSSGMADSSDSAYSADGAAESAGPAGSAASAESDRRTGSAVSAEEAGSAVSMASSGPSGSAESGGSPERAQTADWFSRLDHVGSPGSPGSPDPLDLVGRSVPDQVSAQVKSRAVALAELAYAAARLGELDLARQVGRAANELAGRLEVSQAKRRLRVLSPLLSESRRRQ